MTITFPSPESLGTLHVEHVMGMAVSIDVRHTIDRAAIDAVVAWLHHVDHTYSPFRLDSPISRFGLGELGLTDLDDEVQDVLAACEALHDDTGGAFDILAVPAPNGSRCNPCGFVKGWAIERAAALLEDHGATDFCINAGGDIVVRGAPAPGRTWRVGVRHPEEAHALGAVLELTDHRAVATSATYERGAHIIDPSTGAPTTDLASVTIAGPDLTYADGYATAVFVMGLDGLTWLQEHHPDYWGFAVTHDGRTFATGVGS